MDVNKLLACKKSDEKFRKQGRERRIFRPLLVQVRFPEQLPQLPDWAQGVLLGTGLGLIGGLVIGWLARKE